jgi:glycogen debranching enzyme
VKRARAWIEQRIARHGYVPISRGQANGIQHQFWEHSYDSQFLEDGRLLDGSDAAPYRAALVARLLAPDMLGAAGVRTKSTTAARFAPGSYHNGSIWPVDTGILADGLRRHGYLREADDLEERILIACARAGSAVEFFRGDQDDVIRVNTRVADVLEAGVMRRREQPPQLVQGWTATRLWRILRRGGLVAAPSPTPGLARAA